MYAEDYGTWICLGEGRVWHQFLLHRITFRQSFTPELWYSPKEFLELTPDTMYSKFALGIYSQGVKRDNATFHDGIYLKHMKYLNST